MTAHRGPLGREALQRSLRCYQRPLGVGMNSPEVAPEHVHRTTQPLALRSIEPFIFVKGAFDASEHGRELVHTAPPAQNPGTRDQYTWIVVRHRRWQQAEPRFEAAKIVLPFEQGMECLLEQACGAYGVVGCNGVPDRLGRHLLTREPVAGSLVQASDQRVVTAHDKLVPKNLTKEIVKPAPRVIPVEREDEQVCELE